MRTYDFPASLVRPMARDGRKEYGVFTFIVRGSKVEDALQRDYGRPGLCLKVFRLGGDAPLSEFCWSERTGMLLTDCTRAQNLFARHGLAPRVYDIVRVNDRWAQVTDYVTDDGGTFDRSKVSEVMSRYGIRCRGWDMNEHNWLGSRMVDFQAYQLHADYKDKLVERIWRDTAWGSRKEPYQEVFGEPSQRDTTHRLIEMRLLNIEWEGKTVLDLGCSSGAFCRFAALLDARRVVGVDLPHVGDVAHEIANYYDQWNIDYLGLHLPAEKDEIAKLTGIEQFDVVLCLSCKQLKPVPWAFDLCREVCYFEGHVPDREETHRPTLEQYFSEVEFLGMATDHGPRPLFRCYK